MIIHGDALTELKKLPSESINCCVTSPPYYGLRDYGTAYWEGGRSDCKHVIAKIRTGLGLADSPASIRGGGHKAKDINKIRAKIQCPMCGAKRIDKQVGLEATPEEYIDRLVGVFREVHRVLRDNGTLWINIGDSYAGSGRAGQPKMESENWKPQYGHVGKKTYGLKTKDLIGLPWMLAFALRADGWYLRQDIIWHKPNPMPESVKDRCTKAHEYIFLLTKSSQYYFDNNAIKEPAVSSGPQNSFARKSNTCPSPVSPMQHRAERLDIEYSLQRNKRDVWTIATKAYTGAHFAVFPPDLIRPCILAGCPEGGTVLDPFFGAGTTGLVAEQLGRNYIGIELNLDFINLSKERIDNKESRIAEDEPGYLKQAQEKLIMPTLFDFMEPEEEKSSTAGQMANCQ